MKLKAGTLFFVLLISLVIGILMTSLIMFSFYTRQKNNDDLAFLRLQVNVESTFTYLQSGCMIADRDTSYQLDLYGEEEDSVKINLQPWGAFQVASVSAYHRARLISKSGFLGYLPPDSNTALFLSNKKRDFTLSGNSRIYGNAILPSVSINRGNAEGRYYSGDNFIYSGSVKKNTRPGLPPPDERLLKNVKIKLDDLESLVRKSTIISTDTLVYDKSFHESTTYLRPSGYQLAAGIILKGNIILCSDTIIRIPSSCQLHDIIIIAPSVVFEENFSGTLQVFCKDSIVSRDHCRFTYPSVFGIFKSEFSISTPYIKTGEDSRLEGLFFCIHEVHDLRGSRTSFGQNNHIIGIVYTQGEVELKPGTNVQGTVIASEMILKTSSSQYSNNLLDVVINSTLLPGYFSGTILPPPDSRLTIAKWLP